MKNKNKLKIEPSCSYCIHGNISPLGNEILCVKTGVRDIASYCKRFSYDPLKRIPKKAPLLPAFDESDFAL